MGGARCSCTGVTFAQGVEGLNNECERRTQVSKGDMQDYWCHRLKLRILR